MYKAPVFKADGEKKSKAQALPGSLFDGVVHEPAMWQAVKAYLANQRLGTAATKTRSQVRGGNRKPWRQKGTGRARQGSIRSPQWRGGGNVFGPRGDQSFREKLPRKLKGLARRSAFNARAEDGKVLLVDALAFEAPRTKDIVQLLEGVGAEGNVLLLTDGIKREVYLSARNIPQVQVKVFGQESAYDVLWSDTVVIELSALEALPAGEGATEEVEAAAPAKKARKSKKAAAPEAEAAVEPTATEEAETQPSDSLAGGPAEEATDAEEAPKKKRAPRKKKKKDEE